MLQKLKIQNYAIINHLEIEFRNGFNTITGETGAGKSILLGALGLILGSRVDTSVLQNHTKKCIVEGQFSIKGLGLASLFESFELDYEDQSFFRREILPSGRSRAFINDTPVQLNVMKELAMNIIDIHSQHQSIQIKESRFQLGIIDALAKNNQLLLQYKMAFRNFKSTEHKLETLKSSEARKKSELDFLQFQFNELEAFNPVVDEEGSLEEELKILENAEQILSKAQQYIFINNEKEDNILSLLADQQQLLKDAGKYNSFFETLSKRLTSVELELKDIEQELRNFADQIDMDNGRLDEISQRYNQLQHLLTKHRCTSSTELLALKEDLGRQIAGITKLDDQIATLEAEKHQQEKELRILASRLHHSRAKMLESSAHAIEVLLQDLGMPNAKVEFSLETTEFFTENGTDNINLLFTSNPGNPPQPITKVASGGEISRLMLSIKYLLADSYQTSTLIFDEIDLGISGEVALKVGQILDQLSKNHQLLVITHLPQVAAQANAHFYVYKKVEQNHTETLIKEISEEQRIEEIAKMIGGETPGNAAVSSARELLEKFI